MHCNRQASARDITVKASEFSIEPAPAEQTEKRAPVAVSTTDVQPFTRRETVESQRADDDDYSKLPECWKSEYPSLGVRIVDDSDVATTDQTQDTEFAPSLNEWQNYLMAKLEMNKKRQLGLLPLTRAEVILGPPTPRVRNTST